MKKVNEKYGEGFIRFADKDQAFLWTDEIAGQISDGFWENATPSNHWEAWTGAKVEVGQPAGYFGFHPRRTSYGLNNSELLSVVGDRMRIHLGLYRMLGDKAIQLHHHLPDEESDFEQAERASKGEHGEYWMKRLEDWKAAGITPELVKKAYDSVSLAEVKGLLFKMMKTMKVALPSAEGGAEKPKEEKPAEAPKEEKPKAEPPKEEKPEGSSTGPGRSEYPDEDKLPYESKVNEDAGAQEYHKKLWEFLDHPWQEDNEIELVNMIGQYRGDFKVNPPAPIQDYLKRLVNENGIMGRQGFSDAFMSALQDLMGTNPNQPAKEGEPPVESKKSDEGAKTQNERKHLQENFVNEREWKYRIDLGFLEKFTMGDEDVDDAQAGQVGAQAAEVIRKVAEEVGESNPDLSGQLDGVAGMFQDAGSVEDLDQALEDLYDIGDHYSVWINTTIESKPEERPEGEEEEPMEPGMEESIRTARRLLGLKEKAKEDEPVKVGDLVQIVDANTYRVEVEEATVKAIDEKKGVEITGSTIPVSQKWYGKPYWFISKL